MPVSLEGLTTQRYAGAPQHAQFLKSSLTPPSMSRALLFFSVGLPLPLLAHAAGPLLPCGDGQPIPNMAPSMARLPSPRGHVATCNARAGSRQPVLTGKVKVAWL